MQYTIKDVADKLKLHPNTVRKLIRTKKLKAVKIGRAWSISEEEVQRLIMEGTDAK